MRHESFMRCFSIGSRVEFSYETAESMEKLWPKVLEEIREFEGIDGAACFHTEEGSLIVHASWEGDQS